MALHRFLFFFYIYTMFDMLPIEYLALTFQEPEQTRISVLLPYLSRSCTIFLLQLRHCSEASIHRLSTLNPLYGFQKFEFFRIKVAMQYTQFFLFLSYFNGKNEIPFGHLLSKKQIPKWIPHRTLQSYALQVLRQLLSILHNILWLYIMFFTLRLIFSGYTYFHLPA